MRKRNVHIQFWLDKKEAEAFQKKVKKSGLSREAYLRHLVTGLEPQDAPPPDYYAMMRELHGIGNNLNQLTVLANMGKVQFANLDTAAQEFAKINVTLRQIQEGGRENRNRPFRELQERHTVTRLHEKCHAVCVAGE